MGHSEDRPDILAAGYGYQPRDPLDDINDPPRGGSGVPWGLPPTEPISLQRQIDKLVIQVDALEDYMGFRKEEICELADTAKDLDRACHDARTMALEAKCGANATHERINSIEERLNAAHEYISRQADMLDGFEERLEKLSTAADESDDHRYHTNRLQDNIDEVFNRIAGLAALYDYVEDRLNKQADTIGPMETELGNFNVALHNHDQRIFRLSERVNGLESELAKDAETVEADTWKKRWDALKDRLKPTEADELWQTITFERLAGIMDDLEHK